MSPRVAMIYGSLFDGSYGRAGESGSGGGSGGPPAGAIYWRGTKVDEFTAYSVRPNSDYAGGALPTITENAGTITFEVTGGSTRGGTVMAGKHDLTDYTRLRAKLENPLASARKYMFVTKIANGSGFAISGTNTNFPAFIRFDQTEPGEIEIDLSGISGEYYVGFGLAFNASLAAAKPPVTITISELQLL